MTRSDTTLRSIARPAGAVLVLSLLVAGCVAGQGGSGGTQQPSASPSAPPSASGSPTAEPSSPAKGFYLRAWQTQALAPRYTFSWLPVATISEGKLIDGQVAVPAIYPGPLWVGPSVRSISQKGIDAILAEARKQGLLGSKHDFAGEQMPGSITGHIEMAVDGVKYDLQGDPTALTRCRCIPDPGTAAAFAAFWQRVTDIPGWLGAEVGESSQYDPERIAVLTTAPAEAQSGITPNEVPWPLTTPFASFGTRFGSVTDRCAIVSGTDLAKLLPVVKQANQLTRFVDGADAERSLQVRVLVPGEPGPCGS